jgi:transcriptional regulator with XRE-family HTH domain
MIGQQVRARRMQLHMSLTDVAKRSRLSVPFLSQLERGNTGASLESLTQIAQALEISLSYFCEASPHNPVRAPQQFQRFSLAGSEVVYARMGSSDDECRLEPLLVMLPPYSAAEPPTHTGEAFLLVLQGRLGLWLNSEERTLEAGHTAHFRPGAHYTWRNPTPEEVRLAWVGTPRLF